MPSGYTPPLRDMRFVLDHLVDLPGILALPAFAGIDLDTVHGVLEESGRFFAEVVAPLSRVGDQQGSTIDADGAVTTPDGFKEAYKAYVDAGWGAVPFPAEYGGGGFPWLTTTAMQEMLTAADMAFSLCPLLTQGAIDMLLHYGSEEQKETYLRKMVTGEWTGTMNLTEPEAGSDVGALRTKAAPQPDGTYRITGQKIFITFGEHDMAEQIVHLVLARTPGAPPGTKGISCFIVPKLLVNEDGSLGERNDVRCQSIEHKAGIHASPTCVLSYGDRGGALGFLIGEENQGMRYMFKMMNNARLSVGVEGLAVAERAYQQALAFAQERRQGRALDAPAGEQSPIIAHPDVRRMLITMRAHIEAMRALCYLNAASLDRANFHPDETTRERSRELADLLTPITKGWCTDLGTEMASLNVQIHGGMGFIEETGAAQRWRDSRIAAIYEGTNGIQAMDLVGRKLPMRAGGVISDFLAGIGATSAALDGSLADLRARLDDAAGSLGEATTWIFERGLADPADALAGATPFLRMAGLVTGGWLLARQAQAATELLAAGNGDTSFLEAKIATARFYCNQILPQVPGLLPAVTAGAGELMALDPVQLAG